MGKKRIIPAGRHVKKRGRARMAEFGYKEVQLYLDETEFKAINEAARKDGKRLGTWIREMSYLVACRQEYRKKDSSER